MDGAGLPGVVAGLDTSLRDKVAFGGVHMISSCVSRLAMVAALMGSTWAVPAAAQQQFTRNVGFGDSYVDTGTIVGAFGLGAFYPTGRFSGGTNYFDTTSTLLGISQVNYALGGAATGTTGFAGLPNLGFATEVAGFVGAGQRFTSTDLLTLSIGGNDARAYYMGGGTVAGAAAASATAVTNASTGITTLVGAGARTIIFNVGDVALLPEAQAFAPAQQAAGSAYSRAYNAGMQTYFAGLARSGVRVEYVDNTLILQAILARPGATTITGALCSAACIGNAALASQFLFYFDGIHLTSAGFAVVGQYNVNRLNAPLTFAPQGDASMAVTRSFASSMFGRMDQIAAANGGGSTPATTGQMNLGMMNAGAGNGAASPAYPSGGGRYGLSAFIQAKASVGNVAGTNQNPDFNVISEGGTVGLEYKFNRAAMVGTAFDYTNASARLAGGLGKTEVDAYQLGVYGSYNPSNFFAQGLLSYGTQSIDNRRTGVLLGDLTSAPTARTATAAGKIGYLYDFGAVKAGPIAGLTYATSTVGGYTESGDAALALTVGSQKVEALIASVGMQVRFPVYYAGHHMMPYVNLTLEDDLKGNGRAIQYSATSAPLIVNTWNVNPTTRHIYGRIAGGVSTAVSPNMAINLNLGQTVGRANGDGFSAMGGLTYKF